MIEKKPKKNEKLIDNLNPINNFEWLCPRTVPGNLLLVTDEINNNAVNEFNKLPTNNVDVSSISAFVSPQDNITYNNIIVEIKSSDFERKIVDTSWHRLKENGLVFFVINQEVKFTPENHDDFESVIKPLLCYFDLKEYIITNSSLFYGIKRHSTIDISETRIKEALYNSIYSSRSWIVENFDMMQQLIDENKMLSNKLKEKRISINNLEKKTDIIIKELMMHQASEESAIEERMNIHRMSKDKIDLYSSSERSVLTKGMRVYIAHGFKGIIKRILNRK